MNKKIYVGNLSYSVTDDMLNDTFAQFGTVESVKVIIDRDTNRSKGFAFVEMSTQAEAQDAIRGLSNSELAGRQMSISEATPPTSRPAGNNRRY